MLATIWYSGKSGVQNQNSSLFFLLGRFFCKIKKWSSSFKPEKNLNYFIWQFKLVSDHLRLIQACCPIDLMFKVLRLKTKWVIFFIFQRVTISNKPGVCQDCFCTIICPRFCENLFFVEKRVQRYVKHMD